MKHLISMLGAVLILSAAAQAKELTARILNSAGEPLEGASVISDNNRFATGTDKEGWFTLQSDESVTRVTVSHVGYRTRQFRPDDLPLEIVLDRLYYEYEKIIVTADRAERGISPIAFDNITADEIERDYTVGEFPQLVENTPNVLAYSDAGSALGYSYMKIRGFDDKHVVTYINGVPLNDPEDHATYFFDLPDFAANVTDLQVQRGVGNSLYGDASFGGSINIVTNILSQKKSTILTAGYGEYTSGGKSISEIYKQSFAYSSGLVDGRWAYSGRFSKQKTGGYRYGSWYTGWSYFLAVGRIDPKMTTEVYIYGGPVQTHLAYYGAGRDAINRDRRDNSYNTYDNQTDNFNQPHYQIHNIYRLTDNATLFNTLYYIRGRGYYEQFKESRTYSHYNLSSLSDSSNGDLILQKWVAKSQLGWNPRLDIEHEKGKHTLGGSFYYFKSDHWGQIVQAQFLNEVPNSTLRYYDHFGTKYVGSLYGTEYYRFSERVSAQLTLQMRYQRYLFDQVRMGAFPGYEYELDYLFLSPRIGLNYAVNNETDLYINFAVASRTPSDGAIYDANNPTKVPQLEIDDLTIGASNDTTIRFGDPTIRSERLYDLELGGQYRKEKVRLGLNLFWMSFHDEIISYSITDLPVSYNIDRSVHAGVELSGTVRPTRNLSVGGNFSFNYNRVQSFQRDLGGETVDYKDKKIAGFPDYLGTGLVDYNNDRWRVVFKARILGRQYMELWNIEELSISPAVISTFSLSYSLPDLLNTGHLTILAKVDNLFDKKYEWAGYGDNWTEIGGGGETVVKGWAEYFVAPERSFWSQVKLELF